jgi:hypothetical protein
MRAHLPLPSFPESTPEYAGTGESRRATMACFPALRVLVVAG